MICNKCGKKMDFFDEQADFSLHRHIGYGSGYDGSTLDIRLCCECMDLLIGECLVSPVEDPYDEQELANAYKLSLQGV